MTAINSRQKLYLLQTDIAGAFDRVDRKQLISRLSEAGVRGCLYTLLKSYLTGRSFHVRINGSCSPNFPLDIGVVQGSGLGPVMWNIYFAPVFDATGQNGIGFADDLNLMATNDAHLQDIKRRVLDFCESARITMEPSKEHTTVFYPPRHPERRDQEDTRLVGIQIDSNLNMEAHIKKVIQGARVARRQIIRMKPYCNASQLQTMYKTMIWSRLEVGSVCVSHANETHLQKLENFQNSSLRMLGLTSNPLDSLSIRRKTAHATMLYKQSVLCQGPNYIRKTFPINNDDSRSHLRRTATEKHPYQLKIPYSRNSLQKFNKFCSPIKTFNDLPCDTFPNTPNICELKKKMCASFPTPIN